MNYCDEIRRALLSFDENYTMRWVCLTEVDLKVQGNPGTVARKLMGCRSVRPGTGNLGITPHGASYVFHKDRWRKVVLGKNGKHRLEGSL